MNEIETKELIDEVVRELQSPDNLRLLKYMDEGDVGNLIGIAIAKHLDKDGIQSFLHGLDHGVSLTTGSHDSDDVEAYHFIMEVESPEQRKRAAERLKLLNFGE